MTRLIAASLALVAICCDRVSVTWDESYPESFKVWDDPRVVDCSMDLVADAVKWWADQTCDMAIRCGRGYWNVSVQYDAPPWDVESLGEHAAAATYWEPRFHWVWIYVWDPGTIDVEFRIIVHELGHAFGLGHDDGRTSAMHSPIDVHVPLLADHADLEAIRERFCD